MSENTRPSQGQSPQNTSTSFPGSKRQVAVLGGGSFGTAMAKVLAENGHTVHFWMRDEQQVQELTDKRTNSRYMPDVRIEGDLVPTTDFAAAVTDAEAVFVAIPSKAFRQVIDDPAGHHDWGINAEVDLEASAEQGIAVVRVVSVERL